MKSGKIMDFYENALEKSAKSGHIRENEPAKPKENNRMKTITAMLSVLALTCTATAADLPFKNGEKIAFLGDSITQNGVKNKLGYVNLVMEGIRASGINADVIPAGVSGNTCVHMIKRLDKDVIKKKPDWMFLSCGVNDAPNGIDNPGVPLEQYKKNITAIIEKCQKAGIKVIVLTATPVLEDPSHISNTNLVPYNDFLRAIAKEKDLPLIDLNKRVNAVIEKKADKKELWLTIDGTHMSPYGDILLAYTILQQLGMDKTLLHNCIAKWMADPEGWTVKANLKLSVEEMELLRRNLPAGKSVNEWINDRIRKDIKALEKKD